jgi:hypothetical protein
MFSFKALLFLFVVLFNSVSAQQKLKDYSLIMRSNSVYEIDAFLRDAHPDDPKRLILKPRLIKLLREYIKNAKPGDQRVIEFQEKIALLRRKSSTKISFEEMNEQIRQKQIAFYREELKKDPEAFLRDVAKNLSEISGDSSTNSAPLKYEDSEKEEFEMLISSSPIEHKNTTVQILNSLFDNDPNSKESIVMIENKSDCNMIMRIEGIGNIKYRVAVPRQKEKSIVVPKGNYIFSSLICGAQYSSQKTLQKAIIVALNNPGK